MHRTKGIFGGRAGVDSGAAAQTPFILIPSCSAEIAPQNFTLGHLVGVIFSTQNPTNSKLDTVEYLYQEAKLDAYDPDI